jgi:YHS domain-containing protein
MKLHPLRTLLPLLLASTLGLVLAAIEPVPVNAICPITGKPADSSKFVTYSKDVKFCCEICQKSFVEKPDDMVKEIAAVTPDTKKCLMCEKQADKDIKTTYMRVVAVSDDICKTQFAASPDKYVVFAVSHPRPVNTICPMSGEKVDPKCIATYQKTVLFCGQEHHDAFNKDQDENVEKVAAFDREKGKCLMCDQKYDASHIEVYRRTIGCSTLSHGVAFNAAADANIVKAVKSAK